MTKLKIVVADLELDTSGTEAEVSAALKDFIRTVEAAIGTPAQRRALAQTDEGKTET